MIEARRPIRVLIWSELFWPFVGGAEVFSAEHLGALHGRGFEFAVITSHGDAALPDADRFRGVPVHRFRFHSHTGAVRVEDLFALRRRVVDLTKRLGPDLIHLNGIAPSAFHCLETARKLGIPVLVRLNRELTPKEMLAADSLIANALKSAGWTVAVSQHALAQACGILPQIAARSSVIHTGVRAAAYPRSPPVDDPPILLCLGRLFLRKGFDLAIEALPRILQTYPGLRLVVAGDGPERQALERIAHGSGVAANVDFVGWVTPDEVPSRLAASTLVLVPSHCEGLPLVALQAAAAGRPVMASRAGGLPEIVRDGETGLLVDLEPAAIAAAAVALLNDRERLEQMGAAARRHVEANFDFDRCTEAYAALYRSLATR